MGHYRNMILKTQDTGENLIFTPTYYKLCDLAKYLIRDYILELFDKLSLLENRNYISIDKLIISKNFDKQQIYIVTDSEEIRLTANRNHLNCIYDSSARLEPHAYLYSLQPYLLPFIEDWEDIIVLSPYIPLFKSEGLSEAYKHYQDSGAEILVPVFGMPVREFIAGERSLDKFLHDGNGQNITCESHIFTIFKSSRH